MAKAKTKKQPMTVEQLTENLSDAIKAGDIKNVKKYIKKRSRSES